MDESRQAGARLDPAEQDGRVLFRSDLAGEFECNLARLLGITTERTAERIEDRTLCDPDHIFRQILVSEAGRITGECLTQGSLSRWSVWRASTNPPLRKYDQRRRSLLPRG